MKKTVLIAFLALCNTAVFADMYKSNSFGMMPHKDIMRMVADRCNTEANAMGDKDAATECIASQKIAFNKLTEIYNDQSITAPSWSLCIAQAKYGHIYNYITMYGCMKVVKDICKEKPDGNWENPNLCIKSIESGAWINNPKVYQPYKKS